MRPDWTAITDLLWIRAGGRCEKCGNHLPGPDMCARHHRRMRSAGGRHEVANLLLLCHDCHGWVHLHPHDAMDSGWIVSRYGKDPELAPVWHAIYGLVLLTANGGTRWHAPPLVPRDPPPCAPRGGPL